MTAKTITYMDIVRISTNMLAMIQGTLNGLFPTASGCVKNAWTMNAMTQRHSLAVTAPALRRTLRTTVTASCWAPRICSHHVPHAGSHVRTIPSASIGLGKMSQRVR